MASIADTLGASNLVGVGNTLITAGKVVLWGLLAMGIIWVFIYFVKYKKKVFLFLERDGIPFFTMDRGFPDKKEQKFSLLKNRDVTCPYPQSKYEHQQGRSTVLFGYVKNQSLSWLTIQPNPGFVPADYNMQHHMINDIKGAWEIVKPKQNFWDKYGAQIMWIGSMGVFLIVIILILKRMDNIIALGRSVATAQAEAGKNVVSAMIPFALIRKR